MHITPYLGFQGKCEEAFKLYEKVLKGKITFIMRYGESPMADKTAPEARNQIMHVTLQVGDESISGADAPGQHYSKPAGFSVAISLKDFAEGERIFKELSAGGQVQMPLQKTFWSPGFAMFIDRYGTPWMVNVEGEM
ncbi:MAG TPA: VOC family protein [Terriglobales bacterium]|nr:VOC family protein [Terriglobales bacterium]